MTYSKPFFNVVGYFGLSVVLGCDPGDDNEQKRKSFINFCLTQEVARFGCSNLRLTGCAVFGNSPQAVKYRTQVATFAKYRLETFLKSVSNFDINCRCKMQQCIATSPFLPLKQLKERNAFYKLRMKLTCSQQLFQWTPKQLKADVAKYQAGNMPARNKLPAFFTTSNFRNFEKAAQKLLSQLEAGIILESRVKNSVVLNALRFV